MHFGARLVVEADGGQHNGSCHDAERDAWLRGQGLTVLRFWNHDVHNIKAVLEAILKELAKRAPSPPAPLPQGERGGDRT